MEKDSAEYAPAKSGWRKGEGFHQVLMDPNLLKMPIEMKERFNDFPEKHVATAIEELKKFLRNRRAQMMLFKNTSDLSWKDIEKFMRKICISLENQ